MRLVSLAFSAGMAKMPMSLMAEGASCWMVASATVSIGYCAAVPSVSALRPLACVADA